MTEPDNGQPDDGQPTDDLSPEALRRELADTIAQARSMLGDVEWVPPGVEAGSPLERATRAALIAALDSFRAFVTIDEEGAPSEDDTNQAGRLVAFADVLSGVLQRVRLSDGKVPPGVNEAIARGLAGEASRAVPHEVGPSEAGP